MNQSPSHIELLTLTTEIASSYVSNNKLEQSEIPELIDNIYKSLSSINNVAPHLAERPQPAVPIKRSITEDHIICLEDGKKLKMLKRHLKTAYNMSPEEYRERWGLPADYPMVAPSYAKRRSNLAKDIGLGKKV